MGRNLLFILLILFPTKTSFAFDVGEVVEDHLGRQWVVTDTNTTNSTSLLVSLSTYDDSPFSPCEDIFAFDLGQIWELKNGFFNVGSNRCEFPVATGWNVTTYLSPTYSVPENIGENYTTFNLPLITILGPVNGYTAIFNYFFSVMFWFTLFLLPIKWTIKIFRSR